jgi:hypothetical protein
MDDEAVANMMVGYGFVDAAFVLTVENAKGYFDPSTLIRRTRKQGMARLFRLPGIKRHFADFLREHTDRRHLIRQRSAAVP